MPEPDGNPETSAELEEAQRKYKFAEVENRTGVLGRVSGTPQKSKPGVGKGKAEIPTTEALKKDASQLRSQVETQMSSSKAARPLTRLEKLQEQVEMYNNNVQHEKDRIEELDKQIKHYQGKIQEQRQRMGGVNAVKEANTRTRKEIRTLENRLEQAVVKYNQALSYNKSLREQIDNLRRERVAFDQLYAKLDKELAEKKGEMAKIIEVSNMAYEARDAAQVEIQSLKQQAEKEQQAFETEWRELGKLIEQDRKLKEYLQQQCNATQMQINNEHMQEKRRENRKHQKDEKKKTQAAALEKKDKSDDKDQAVQSYEDAFAKIQAATGISDIDELVSTFINAEDKNFSLFNYVNELNIEVERLEEQIAEVKSEIEQYKGQGTSTDNQRKKLIKELELQLAKTDAKAEQYEAKAASAMKTVNQLKSGIQRVFNKIGCQASAGSDMLGSQGVTESNMQQCLGMIEQRTNEILQLYATAQMKAHGMSEADAPFSVSNILGSGPQVPTGSLNLSINPPTTTEDSDADSEDSDDMDRPLTREELKQKTLRGLLRRDEQKAGHKGAPGGKTVKKGQGKKPPAQAAPQRPGSRPEA
jgi:chromosome segregation ATPase